MVFYDDAGLSVTTTFRPPQPEQQWIFICQYLLGVLLDQAPLDHGRLYRFYRPHRRLLLFQRETPTTIEGTSHEGPPPYHRRSKQHSSSSPRTQSGAYPGSTPIAARLMSLRSTRSSLSPCVGPSFTWPSFIHQHPLPAVSQGGLLPTPSCRPFNTFHLCPRPLRSPSTRRRAALSSPTSCRPSPRSSNTTLKAKLLESTLSAADLPLQPNTSVQDFNRASSSSTRSSHPGSVLSLII